MFTKILLASGVILQSFNSELNNILRDYVKPILFVLIILASIKGIINSIELINDKEERGTTKDGFLKLGLIVGGVVLAIIVLNVVINKLTGLQLQIS